MKKTIAISALVLTLGLAIDAYAAGGFTGATNTAGGFTGHNIAPSKVSDVKEMNDDAVVVLIGNIKKSLGNDKYTFYDDSGSITIEIDNDDWGGIFVAPEDIITIRGEVDKDFMKNPEIDVDQIIKK